MADRVGEHVGLHLIPPGQPLLIGHIESFNLSATNPSTSTLP